MVLMEGSCPNLSIKICLWVVSLPSDIEEFSSVSKFREAMHHHLSNLPAPSSPPPPPPDRVCLAPSPKHPAVNRPAVTGVYVLVNKKWTSPERVAPKTLQRLAYRGKLTPAVLSILYKTIVRSCQEYASIVWDDGSTEDTRTPQRIQLSLACAVLPNCKKWHFPAVDYQFIGISRKVEFCGCPGMRQCLGTRGAGYKSGGWACVLPLLFLS